MKYAADISWPSTIPLPALEFQGGLVDSTLVSKSDQGLIQKRARFTPNYPALSLSWVLTPTQYAAFTTFFEDTLFDGMAIFALALRFPVNTSLKTWGVRFEGNFSSIQSERNGMWKVEANANVIGLISDLA